MIKSIFKINSIVKENALLKKTNHDLQSYCNYLESEIKALKDSVAANEKATKTPPTMAANKQPRRGRPTQKSNA